MFSDVNPAVVKARCLYHSFGSGPVARHVLNDINFTMHSGEIILLTGPSGSGKTTLLTLIGGLRAVQRGSCVVGGRELSGASDLDRAALRRRIGFVFQEHRLLNFLTARQNVAMALETETNLSDHERSEWADLMLMAVGLAEKTGSLPAELSGGQKQRVALARALVRQPELVLADEPTAALDRQSGAEVMDLLTILARERGVPVLIVTHDNRILNMADRIVRIEDGMTVPDKEWARENISEAS